MSLSKREVPETETLKSTLPHFYQQNLPEFKFKLKGTPNTFLIKSLIEFNIYFVPTAKQSRLVDVVCYAAYIWHSGD